MQKGYCSFNKSLLYATHFHTIDQDGVIGEVKIPDKAKLIYLHMYEMYQLFTKDGGSYYETQERIGRHFGITRKQVVTNIKVLQLIGLVSVTKAKGFRQWDTVVHPVTYRGLKFSRAKFTLEEKLYNNKLIEKDLPKTKEIKTKMSSEDYMTLQSNLKRWERESLRIKEERKDPYTDHCTAHNKDYREFLEWKRNNKGVNDE